MKKRSLYILSAAGIIIYLVLALSSATQKQLVDYQVVQVPEEGSLKLTQYTREDEKVVHPYIAVNATTGLLNWYAPSMLAVSPDGQKIAYIGLANEFKNLYIKDIGGGKLTVQRTFYSNIMDMAYSPDGKHLVYTERKTDNDNIYMRNASEGMAVQQLVSTNAQELSPTFTKDGKNIFFVKSEGARYYIWSLNISTSLLTQYTEGFTPNLSPKGDEMLVTRNSRDGARGEVWIINIDKGSETQILSDPKKGYSSARYSPDGKKIICVGISEADATKPQNLDLFMLNPDGTGLTQLTFHGGHDCSPVWTPDGKSLFFLSQRGNKDGQYNVWRMDVNF